MAYRLRGFGARGTDVGVSSPAVVGGPFGVVTSTDPIPDKRAGVASDTRGLPPFLNLTPAPTVNVTPPAPVVVAVPLPVADSTSASSGSWLTDSLLFGIPNWMLLAGGGALFLFSGGHRR